MLKIDNISKDFSENNIINIEKNNENNSSLDNNPLINLIKDILKKNNLSSEEILYNKEFISLGIIYTNTLISNYFKENEIINIDKKKILLNKKNLVNYKYFKKILSIDKKNNNYKDLNCKIIYNFYLSFIYNVYKYVLKSKNEKKSYKKIYILNQLLNISFNFILKLYIDSIINDDCFELILLILLKFSISKSNNIISNNTCEIINMIFFNSTIKLIKIVYNKLYRLYNQFSPQQTKIINNIILYINNNLLGKGIFDKTDYYINKVYLYKNDFKSSSLIELSSIIFHMKSKDIINNYLDLLSNIYIFSLENQNLMGPIIKQLEPLFININKKNINQIENELNITDFSISLINTLVDKESHILKNNLYSLRHGFYFGKEKCGIIYDFNSLDNEFFIMLGLKVEQNKNDILTIFQIINSQTNTSQLKIYLFKNKKNIYYEMIVEDKKAGINSNIKVFTNKTYIFIFHIKNKGLMKESQLKINYVYDKNEIEKENKNNFYSIEDLKIKNIKTENIRLYLGCEMNEKNFDEIKNPFEGFIGDLLIFNKNIKSISNELDIYKLLTNLKGNYYSILNLCLENLQNNPIFYNSNNIDKCDIFNKNYIKIKEKISSSKENNNKLFDSIKGAIIPDFFKIIEYKDNIDYLNFVDNYDYFLNKKNISMDIKKKYFVFKDKYEVLENEKIKITTSVFDKYFHIFYNKSSLMEFIKYDGIHFLCLILEYYYQILNRIILIKDEHQNNTISNVIQKINEKILYILNFFYQKIIQEKIYIYFINEINRFIYQLALILIKIIEIDELNFDIIKYLVILLNFFIDYDNNYYSNNTNNDKILINKIRNNLFDFLLNPKLYNNKDTNSLKKLNYVFQNFLDIIKNKNNKNSIINYLLNINTINKLLSYTWLYNNCNIDENIIINDKNENRNIYDIIINNFSLFLIEVLKLLKENITKNSGKNLSNDNLYEVKIEKEKEKDNNEQLSQVFRSSISSKSEKRNSNKKLLEYFYDKVLEPKNYKIFANMIMILIKSNLITHLEEYRIENIKNLIDKLLKEKNYKSIDNKKLLLLSCLQILIIYYFSEDKSDLSSKEINKQKKEEFHSFLRKKDLNLDFFYSIINALKVVKFFSSSSTDEIEEIELTYEVIDKKIINDINNNEIEKEANLDDIIENKKLLSICNIPFKEINIEKLNNLQISIIKNILEDIVYLLYKFEKVNKYKKNDKLNLKYNESSSSTLSLDQSNDTGYEIYDTLKKNLDYFFQYNKSKIFNEIFSSRTEICTELFYLRWKISKGDEEIKNIEDIIKNYHLTLLKNHTCPFIFKFIIILSSNKISLDINKNEFDENNSKATLLAFIIGVLNSYHEELKISKKTNLFLINNLLNVILILNNELDSNSKALFQNSAFLEIFDIYISLLHQSGLLYSNFYIEFDNKYGKIISEIILDIYFSISIYSYDEKQFSEIFVKVNDELDDDDDEKYFTIFYFIDILKENILENDQKFKVYLNKYFPEIIIDNLIYINKNYFTQKKILKSIKLFQKRKLYPIRNVCFSLYFLAKIYIYLETNNFQMQFVKLLREKFLPLLSFNILRLYSKRKICYGSEICNKFPLYYKTKEFFETVIIQDPMRVDKYQKFFKIDMLTTLKEEYNTILCYSSRLLNISIKNKDGILDKIFNLNKRKSINDNNKEIYRKSYNLINSNLSMSLKLNCSESLKDLSSSNSLIMEDEINSSKCSDISKSSIDKEEQEFYSTFEIISRSSIYNPKNYFLKTIFSNIFKNIIFNDNVFKSIRASYLIKYRKYKSIIKESKQINYPVKQKNFSNSIEPRIFMRRDYNFYDKLFFPVSHNYINSKILEDKIENIYFYSRNYRIKEICNKFFYCELVTSQYVYFGKMYICNDFLFFKTKKESPINNNKNEIDLGLYEKYAITSMDENNKTTKKKSVLIFTNEIMEIDQRRTLLISQSIEIFLKNGKSYFFNFFRTTEANKLYHYLEEINDNLLSKGLNKFIFNIINNKIYQENINNMLELFKKGKISNYEYILYLNKYSTRTYNDLSQYPIFPWLVFKHEKMNYIFEEILKGEEDKINYLRDLKYPISAQTQEKREDYKKNYEEMENRGKKFPCHFLNHYSNSAYVFYYLMRINPYTQNLIKLQSFHMEEADRMFNSYSDMESILITGSDNRELVPDIFCYIDYFCNLNCNFYGIKKSNLDIIDDFKMQKLLSNTNLTNISLYIDSLYNNRKFINSNYISEKINKWVDNIFGEKQIPKSGKILCFNIFEKNTYEQNLNLESKMEKYKKLINNKKMTKKEFINKIENKSVILQSFGMTPKQILYHSSKYIIESKKFEKKNNLINLGEDEFIYGIKLYDNNYLFLKKDIKKLGSQMAIICEHENLNSKENYIYNCKYFVSPKEDFDNNTPLYKINYAITALNFQMEEIKSSNLIILSCRYLGNYFKVQNNFAIKNIICEDFVTCIKEHNISNKNKGAFYTGLLNGKLIKWNISIIANNLNQNKKNKNNFTFNFDIKETNHVYAHKSSITAIEVYNRQNIVITAGEDKFIFIRKTFDFELLTVIDLTYSFGNPIVSKTINIFPSLIKISDLNLLYVLIYDFDSKYTYIRGYNLNGLFFAQTNPLKFKKRDIYFQFNNFSFTKNSNLITWYNNSKYVDILSASELTRIWNKNIDCTCEISNIINFEYNYSSKEFYILLEKEFIVITFDKEEENKLYESL